MANGTIILQKFSTDTAGFSMIQVNQKLQFVISDGDGTTAKYTINHGQAIDLKTALDDAISRMKKNTKG